MEPSSAGSAGPTTRSQARKRPSSGGAAGGTPLRSPTLAQYFSAQPRKQARTAPATLRQVRKRGGSSDLVQLSGYLGLLPDEVGP